MIKYKKTLVLLITLLLFINCKTLINKNNYMNYNLDFYTDYNQFYIVDAKKHFSQKNSIEWSSEEYNRRLIVNNGIIAIRTASKGHIKGELKILKSKSNITDYSSYDYVIEATITIEDDKLQLLGCPLNDNILTLNVKNGNYRIRIYSKNILTADEDEDENNDSYLIEIWETKDSDYETLVIKQLND